MNLFTLRDRPEVLRCDYPAVAGVERGKSSERRKPILRGSLVGSAGGQGGVMLLQVPYVPGRSDHHLAFEPARPDLVLPGAKAWVLVGFEVPLPIAKVFLGHLETLAEAAGVVYRFVVAFFVFHDQGGDSEVGIAEDLNREARRGCCVVAGREGCAEGSGLVAFVALCGVLHGTARGVVEAIYWKPEIRWYIDRITVLKPIAFTSVRRNEVKNKIGAGAEKAMKDGVGRLAFYIDEDDNRQQRATLMLREVGYVIDAHIEIRSGPDNIAKHLDQFNRRARKGMCFTRPYFGCREFAADFELLAAESAMPSVHPSLLGERDMGWMLHDIDFADPKDKQIKFFHALMHDGVIDVVACTAGGLVG